MFDLLCNFQWAVVEKEAALCQEIDGGHLCTFGGALRIHTLA